MSFSCVDALLREALSLHEQGLLKAAESRYDEVLASEPTNQDALLHIAIIRIQEGRPEDSLILTRQVLAQDWECAKAHSVAATALHILRRPAEAAASFEEALARNSDDAEANFGLASALQTLERHEEAIACYDRALSLEPDYIEAYCGRAASFHATKRYHAALLSYEQGIAVDSDFAEAHYGRGNALQALQRDEEAVACYEKALTLNPRYPQAFTHMGRALQRLGRREEALRHFRHAIEISPDYADAYLDLGVFLEEIGRLEEARVLFEKAVTLEPNNARAYYALFNSRPARRGEPHLASLEAQFESARTHNVDDQALLHFAFGKALEAIGENKLAFEHWSEGNALKRQQIIYDEPAVLGMFERVKAVFTKRLLQSKNGVGDPSAVPIFIVGMPRSGSTLVEQILASHRDVFGGGELRDLLNTMREFGLEDPKSPFPEAVLEFSNRRLRGFGSNYVARLAAAAPGKRITDKALANFCAIGLIHLALPNARIIHVYRDPVDTCLSCYSLLFSNDQPFTFDLGELGRYYAAYHRLMAHWRDILPAGVMLDVRYEDVVSDVESQVHNILSHCDLGWDDACLEFHKTNRPVRTASVTQVRQPIYASSVRRWRPDNTVLRPLLEPLELLYVSDLSTAPHPIPRPDKP